MNNFFNDKLYSKYYPLETEADKNEFLENHGMEMYETVADINRIIENHITDRQYDYLRKMKPEVSFTGNLKCGNVIYNKGLMQEMKADWDMKIASDQLSDTEALSRSLLFNEYDKVSIDEVNSLLRHRNSNRHISIIQGLVGVIFIVGVIISMAILA